VFPSPLLRFSRCPRRRSRFFFFFFPRGIFSVESRLEVIFPLVPPSAVESQGRAPLLSLTGRVCAVFFLILPRISAAFIQRPSFLALGGKIIHSVFPPPLIFQAQYEGVPPFLFIWRGCRPRWTALSPPSFCTCCRQRPFFFFHNRETMLACASFKAPPFLFQKKRLYITPPLFCLFCFPPPSGPFRDEAGAFFPPGSARERWP